MKNYTVMLMYPDYIAENWGEDTYLAHVEATTPRSAVRKARDAFDQALVESDGEGMNDLTDAAVVCCFEGHHKDLNPE